MTKEELRAKYARISSDFSEIEMLKDQLIESGMLEVAQKDPANAGKSVVFNEQGELTAGEGGGSAGLTLYKHTIRYRWSNGSGVLSAVSSLSYAAKTVWEMAGMTNSLMTALHGGHEEGGQYVQDVYLSYVNNAYFTNITGGYGQPVHASLYQFNFDTTSLTMKATLQADDIEFVSDTVEPF